MLGFLAFAAAGLIALWQGALIALGRASLKDKATQTWLKAALWLGLVAVAFSAKLFPLAFMLLLAAGGVFAIEYWRERVIAASDQAAPGAGIAAAPEALSDAAAVLGLKQDASADEIRAAHKRLISQLHPDKGGTDYLAAKINAARAAMLARIGENSAE